MKLAKVAPPSLLLAMVAMAGVHCGDPNGERETNGAADVSSYAVDEHDQRTVDAESTALSLRYVVKYHERMGGLKNATRFGLSIRGFVEPIQSVFATFLTNTSEFLCEDEDDETLACVVYDGPAERPGVPVLGRARLGSNSIHVCDLQHSWVGKGDTFWNNVTSVANQDRDGFRDAAYGPGVEELQLRAVALSLDGLTVSTLASSVGPLGGSDVERALLHCDAPPPPAQCYMMQNRAPYYPWRPIVEALLGRESCNEMDACAEGGTCTKWARCATCPPLALPEDTCGNGVVDSGEECDEPGNPLACTDECQRV